MPLSDLIKGAIVGAGLTFGIAILHYYYIDKPTMDTADKATADAEAARKRAEARAAQQADQLAALQKRSEEIKTQFQQAKGQFISHVTDAVNDGVAPVPGAEPNRPVPPNVVTRTTLARARSSMILRETAKTEGRRFARSCLRFAPA